MTAFQAITLALFVRERTGGTHRCYWDYEGGGLSDMGQHTRAVVEFAAAGRILVGKVFQDYRGLLSAARAAGDTVLASIDALSDWLTGEEDRAWAHLQRPA